MTDAAVWSELAELGSATVYEAAGLDAALDPGIRTIWPGATLAGPALPVVAHPADNLALHRAVAQARPGEILVVDGGGVLCGYWGEVLAVAAMTAGVTGLVIDGGVRDTRELTRMEFPVFARGIGIRRTQKHHPGRVGEAAVVAGVPVTRGDIVVADDDGVLVLPADALHTALAAARARATAEQTYLRRIKGGESTLDLYRLPG